MNPHMKTPVTFLGDMSGEAEVAVVLLHGRRQTEEDTFRVGERIGLDNVLYALPSAQERTWYPHGFMAALEDNQPWLNYGLETLAATVAALEERGFSRHKIVFMGFSQGACLAAEFVYRNPDRWGGLVAFTGGLFGPKGMIWEGAGSFDEMPVFLGTSDVDSWVPLERVRDSAEVFINMGASVDMRVYPGMEHKVNRDELEAARAMLSKMLVQETAVECA
ncbi:phospholipase [Hahella sp. KA22]|uniref:alpha/beta hydrolase n=1 Tax=Hahella sp. KA22 TaxID=1628392 RepID=UPI000FDF109E|nr:dienelactone hydrolase family protein [Hahella sp. KA22]AZZ90132.1 phospholipase [Hahella sp. KA22]QAY53502.1 phospholipase [Hahella sp. KA22]